MKHSILFFFCFSVSLSWANRALYVDGFATILGDQTAENGLLQFAQSRNIKKLLLYQLHLVHAQHDLTNPTTNQILADFISKAKTQYGILEMGAVGESLFPFQNRFILYNNSRPNTNEKFDVFNLEFEFWVSSSTDPGGYYCTSYLQPNGFSCDNAGAFSFFMQEMTAIKALAQTSSHPISAEAYVGWPSQAQAQSIHTVVDKILVHAYVSSPTSAFSYADTRLYDFGSNSSQINVSIIYSSEPSFMQTWLEQNDILLAESIFISDFNADTNANLNYINLTDFSYFAYSDLKNVVLDKTVNLEENKEFNWSIFPNPATDVLTIRFNKYPTNENSIVIYNALGEKITCVFSVGLNENAAQINVANLESGYYFISVDSSRLVPFTICR